MPVNRTENLAIAAIYTGSKEIGQVLYSNPTGDPESGVMRNQPRAFAIALTICSLRS